VRRQLSPLCDGQRLGVAPGLDQLLRRLQVAGVTGVDGQPVTRVVAFSFMESPRVVWS
jgi:hypothetical protein